MSQSEIPVSIHDERIKVGVAAFYVQRQPAVDCRLPAPVVLLRLPAPGQFVTPDELRRLADVIDTLYPGVPELGESFGGTD